MASVARAEDVLPTVRSILLNPTYIGLGIANRYSSAIYHQRTPEAPKPVHTDTKTLAQGKRLPTKVRPRSEWHERKEQALLGLLQPEVRGMATEKLNRHLDELADGRIPVVDKDRHRSSEYLLKGILTSKQGGYPMTGRPTGRKPYRKRYYAVSRAFSAPKSGDSVLRKQVPAEPLEQCVLAVLRAMLLRAPDVRERIKDAIRRHHRETTVNDADLAVLKEKREAVRRKLEFALDELDEIGRDAVKAKIKKWQNQLRSIDKRIGRRRLAADPKEKDVEDMTDAIIGRVTELGESMDTLPIPATRRLLEAVIHRAIVDLETRNVELELRLPSWLLDASKPMCLDTTFGCKTDIETHHENGVWLMKMRLLWLQQSYEFGGYDFADAA